ncbi:MAG: hypothetical protein JXR19_07100 [Bacteroidia bacterium]
MRKKNLYIYTAGLILLIGSFAFMNSGCKDKENEEITVLLCDGNGSSSLWPADIGNRWTYEVVKDGVKDTTTGRLHNFKDSTFLNTKYFGVESYVSFWGVQHYYRTDASTGDLILFHPSNYKEYLECPGDPVLGSRWSYYFSTREVTGVNVSLSTPYCEYTGLTEITQDGSNIDKVIYYKKGLGIVKQISYGGLYNKFEYTLKEVSF